MLYLSYDQPINRGDLPALNASFDRLKARIGRRRALSVVCSTLCLLLYAALMILGTVGIYRRVAGEEYAAALDALPYAKELFTALFQTLPERLSMEFPLPELLCIPLAAILPPLLCMPVALVLRVLLCLWNPPARERGAEELLSEARKLSGRSSKRRKAPWITLSSLLILAAFAAALVYSLIAVHPAGAPWEIKPLLSCAALCLVVFFGSRVQGMLTDIPLEMLCGLDAQWDGTSLIADLEAFIAKEAAPAAERDERAAEAERPGEERTP